MKITAGLWADGPGFESSRPFISRATLGKLPKPAGLAASVMPTLWDHPENFSKYATGTEQVPIRYQLKICRDAQHFNPQAARAAYK